MKSSLAGTLAIFLCISYAHTQQASGNSTEDLQKRVTQLEAEVNELKQIVRQLQPGTVAARDTVSAPAIPAVDPQPAPTQTLVSNSPRPEDDRKELDFLHATTINLGLDTYYEYNFNNPVGRVNLLRAYDVLSNEFSLNQASLVLEHAPDVSAGRRWGGRLDLQFGQASDTSQGNPVNEPRPDIYRNIFQAYGTYVAPLGKGITVDFGNNEMRVVRRSDGKILSTYGRQGRNAGFFHWLHVVAVDKHGVVYTGEVGDAKRLQRWVPTNGAPMQVAAHQ